MALLEAIQLDKFYGVGAVTMLMIRRGAIQGRTKIVMIKLVAVVISIVSVGAFFSSAVAACYWNSATMQFNGDPVEQALCLTPELSQSGVPLRTLNALPPTIDELVGRSIEFSRDLVEQYFADYGIREPEIGGSLALRVSLVKGEPAIFFVIHDTNGPDFGTRLFPPDISISKHINNLRQFGRRWHVIIGRDGQSDTLIDFFTPLRSTRFEVKKVGKRSKGRFLHVALLQPVRTAENEIKIPSQPFTPAQYERLAQVYLAASRRAGRWLIPVYAAELNRKGRETVILGGPKGFSMSAWADAIRKVYRELYTRQS